MHTVLRRPRHPLQLPDLLIFDDAPLVAGARAWYPNVRFRGEGAADLRGLIVHQPSHVVFVIEDDDSTRAAYESLLTSAGFAVRAFESAETFLAGASTGLPCCVVLDVVLGATSGLDLQQKIASWDPPPPIVFVSGQADVPTSVRAMKAGAVEFLTKPLGAEDLLAAVERALRQSQQAHQARAELAALRARVTSLTPREHQVMCLVLGGLPNKQIAGTMGISEVTVKIHRGKVMQKLGAGSVAELVRMADRVGIRPTGVRPRSP